MKKKLLIIEVEELKRDAAIPPCAFHELSGNSIYPIMMSETIGQNPTAFSESRSFYKVAHVHKVEDAPDDLSEAVFNLTQKVITHTYENGSQDVWTKLNFIEYLQETLIPDLRESGKDATADDFETCIKFMS